MPLGLQFWAQTDAPRFANFGSNRWYFGGRGFDRPIGSFEPFTACHLSGLATSIFIGTALAFSAPWLGGWCPLGAALRESCAGSSLHLVATASEVVDFQQLPFYQGPSCMNTQELILAELRNLRVDLAEISARVTSLEQRGAASGTSGAFVTPPQSPLVINYTGGAVPAALSPPFPQQGAAVATSPATSSLAVGQTGAASLPPFPQHSSVAPTSPATSSLAATPSTLTGEPQQLEAERWLVAEEAGQFIQRSLAGDHRGRSGRERVRQASRFYLLFRDFQGTDFNPIQVHRSWGSIKPLVKPNGHCGDSVFIGWPTLQEARLCCAAAGVNWPPNV